ncbi:alginate export family protein [Flammeovirgaceae bacterium SG7u.111]|nr:alginate export family protein [Flammeovirgaceae bacterium SG7u.132]WPO33387.1 alginate export family protein [Flammeovirgaceae bacterium SG7u.111]
MKKTLLLIVVLIHIGVYSASAQFTVDVDFRIRSEYRDGARIMLDSSKQAAFVSSQRTRLITTYKKDKLELRFGIQNARIWGQDKERANVGNVNLSEGWLKYQLSPYFSVQAGRQHMVLDDGRIFGKRNWNDIAVSHDLAVLHFNKDSWSVKTGAAYNNESNNFQEAPYTVNYYKYLAFAWAHKKVSDNLQLSFLTSVDANEDEDDFKKIYPRYTSGFYAKVGSGGSKFDMQASAYYQYGKNPVGLKQRAYMFSIIPKYKISSTLTGVLGVNFISGNDELDTDNNENNAFNKLFGDGHRYYGYMDYFLNIESNTKGAGMRELFASVFIKTGEKSTLEISIHNFALAGNLLATNEQNSMVAIDKSLGNEIDLQYTQKISKDLSFRASYSTMLAQPSMEALKGGDHQRYQQWAAIMLMAKPTLFTSKEPTVPNK